MKFVWTRTVSDSGHPAAADKCHAFSRPFCHAPFSCCFNTIGFLLGLFFRSCLYFRYPYFLPSSPDILSALFSKENRRDSLARVYAMWNATSLTNIVVAFICGIFHHGFSFFQPPDLSNVWNTRREDDKWWLLPTVLLLFKFIQARFVDWHIANLGFSVILVVTSEALILFFGTSVASFCFVNVHRCGFHRCIRFCFVNFRSCA